MFDKEIAVIYFEYKYEQGLFENYLFIIFSTENSYNFGVRGGSPAIVNDCVPDNKCIVGIADFFTAVMHHLSASAILITPNMFLNNSSFLKISQNPIGIAIFQSPRIADKFEFYLARFPWTANCVVKYIRTRQDKLRAKSSLLSAKKVSPFWN